MEEKFLITNRDAEDDILDLTEEAAVTGLYKKAVSLDCALERSKRKSGVRGLCGSCNNLSYVRTEFGIKKITCGSFNFGENGRPMSLRDNEPVTDCSEYEESGLMNLRDMAGIAWEITVKPEPMGFKPLKEIQKEIEGFCKKRCT